MGCSRSPASSPGSPTTPGARLPTGCTSLWNELQDTVRNAKYHAPGVHGLTGIGPLVCLFHIADGQRATASFAGHCHPGRPQDSGGVRPAPLAQRPPSLRALPGLTTIPGMRGDVAPVKPPVDDGGRDTNGHTGESHCLAPGSLDELLGRSHHLGGHWGDQSTSEGCKGQREEERGWRAGLRLDWAMGTHPGAPGPCSLQPNSSLRSGQSLSSSQWKLAGMHVFVETQRNCVGPHTSSGRLAARGQSRAVWAASTALREDHPHSLPTFPWCPQGHSLFSTT